MKKVRAVIFDVYHTLLAVEQGPADAEARWVELWRDFFGMDPAFSLAAFDRTCREIVVEDHAWKKKDGVIWPEVDWESVAVLAADELSGLGRANLNTFLFEHAKLQRRTSAMPGAAAFLTEIRQRGILTGIASNAQRYTFDELGAAGIATGDFAEDLCFWSFEQGFSKPDPAVFAWLAQRLAAREILPSETLMIGDRLDNDIAPAEAGGWQTWHFQGSWPGV